MNLSEFVMNVFMIVGMLVCIIVTAIALFYGTCYFVRILIKTFNAKVKSTTEIMLEDIKEKNIAKKERNKTKREAVKKQKEEKLQLKLESKEEINKMKLQKYQDKLYEKENKNWNKMFGDAPRQEFRDHKINVFEMGKEKEQPEQETDSSEETEKKVDFEPQVITGEDNDFKFSGDLDEDVTTDLSGLNANEEKNEDAEASDSEKSSEETELLTDENSSEKEAEENDETADSQDKNLEENSVNLNELSGESKTEEKSENSENETETEEEKQESALKTEENEPNEESDKQSEDLSPKGIFEEDGKENSHPEEQKGKNKKWPWKKRK